MQVLTADEKAVPFYENLVLKKQEKLLPCGFIKEMNTKKVTRKRNK